MIYKETKIWKRLSSTQVVRFVCFESIEEKRFAIQNADFFYMPFSSSQIILADKRQIELFAEESITYRSQWYASELEAIEAHEKEFSDFFEPEFKA